MRRLLLLFFPKMVATAVTAAAFGFALPDRPGTAPAPMNPAVGVSVLADADRYILPRGAGARDGSSWENALDASAGGLQAGWDMLPPGGTLWVGSGTYAEATLRIRSGGEEGRPKTLAGRDTGGGIPVFVGTFRKDRPATTGATFLSITNGSDYWNVQDIRLRGYRMGIVSGEGGHQGVRIRNFDVTGCREGISLSGGATVEKPEQGTHDVEIRDCEFVGYTKRGIRLRNGNYDVRIIDCVADAGGTAWATEPFQMGFSVEGAYAARRDGRASALPASDHDITFTHCVALSSYHDAGEKYWNADGFVAERGVKNLRFTNCMAFDNTDGGWDSKADNVLLENCVAVGNKRNYRFWGETRMVNCLAAYSVYPGGSGGDLGLWASASVTAERCTFHNNGANVSAAEGEGRITLVHSILSQSRERAGTVLSRDPADKRDRVRPVDSLVWDEAKGVGEDPQYAAPSASWEGQGDAFNSRKFGAGKGYFNASSPGAGKLPFRRALPLAPAPGRNANGQRRIL